MSQVWMGNFTRKLKKFHYFSIKRTKSDLWDTGYAII